MNLTTPELAPIAAMARRTTLGAKPGEVRFVIATRSVSTFLFACSLVGQPAIALADEARPRVAEPEVVRPSGRLGVSFTPWSDPRHGLVRLEGEIEGRNHVAVGGAWVTDWGRSPEAGWVGWARWEPIRLGALRVGMLGGMVRPYFPPTCPGMPGYPCPAYAPGAPQPFIALPMTVEFLEVAWLRFTPAIGYDAQRYYERFWFPGDIASSATSGVPLAELGARFGCVEVALRLSGAPMAVRWRF